MNNVDHRNRTQRRFAGNVCGERRGAAAVEMAIVAPVLLLFALAAVDFGRIVHHYTVVSNAARAGAEYGSMHGFTTVTRSSWETSVRAAVAEEMQSLANFASGDLTVEVATTVDGDDLFRCAVQASYPFGTTIVWPGLPATTQLSHRVEMRRIQ